MSEPIDTVDQNILKILQDDARISFINIARQLELSESTIRHRISRLEDNGIIKKYSIIVDPKKIGYHGVAVVGLDVEPSRFLAVAIQLTEMSEIRTVSTTTGDHMILCEVWLRDGIELAKFVTERLSGIDGVTKICPAIIHEYLKV